MAHRKRDAVPLCACEGRGNVTWNGIHRESCAWLQWSRRNPRPQKPQSRSEQAARFRYDTGATLKDAAHKFSVTPQAVSLFYRKLFGDTAPQGGMTHNDQTEVIMAHVFAFHEELTGGEIAADLGVKANAVAYVARRAGIKMKDARLIPEESIEAAIAAVESGHTITEAAVNHGMHYDTLRANLKKRGVRIVGGRKRRGLSMAAAEMVLAGTPMKDVVKQFKIARSTVYKAIDRIKRAGPPSE